MGERHPAGRLIPAHAGSTCALACRLWPTGAHPRSRGEHVIWPFTSGVAYGSSPLTRGAHIREALTRTTRGLIPAHAGSTPSQSSTMHRQPAHPRSRGEHGVFEIDSIGPAGSSPLTRGALRVGLRRLWMTWAHPRSRGEHFFMPSRNIEGFGSSPLTRGALLSRVDRPGKSRLIPAHAGSTPAWLVRSLARRAHPRSRGEHVELAFTLRRFFGSSPLTRGAPRTGGFIP